MERAEIEQKVVAILHDQKTLPDEPIDPGQLLSELGLDSLDALNMIFAVEETFDIKISDDQARAIRTLSQMVDTIEGLRPSA